MKGNKPDRKQCERFIRDVLALYLEGRELSSHGELFAPDVLCVGTAQGENYRSREELLRFLSRERERFPERFRLKKVDCECRRITPEVYAAFARVEAVPDFFEYGVLKLFFRFTAVLAWREGGFRVEQVHVSLPTELLECGGLLDRGQVKRLRELDPLTGILNIDGFVRKMDQGIQDHPKRRYAAMKFGINNFRYINRSYGYKVGDLVLQNIAKNLSGMCGEEEFCAHMEKDIFALFIKYPENREALDRRLGRMLTHLLDADIKERIQSEVTFTGGVYVLPQNCREEGKGILDKMLIAEEHAKTMGYKSRYAYFEEDMYNRLVYNGGLQENAPLALENREFKLYIQPQVDIATGRPVAGEALVRWLAADGTLIQPDAFIPLFEQTGFIEKLDFYMLETLCREMKKWMEQGLVLAPISINQSRKHLLSETYVEDFCRVVDRYGIPHSYIAFELTESTFAEYNDQMLKMARELHLRGFQLAIDDFGTGYASFNLLGVVSADILKVDKSLLADVEELERSRVVLRKVIEMARETRMKVVCEGIETKAQYEYLRQLDCDLGQGFYFYRPMPVEQFERQVLRGAPKPREQTG